MYTTTETAQSVSVTTAAATASGASVVTGDPAEFLQQLRSHMKEAMNQVGDAMEQFAAQFPGASVRTGEMGSFSMVMQQSSAAGADLSINLSQDVIQQMADDDEFFQKVKDMVGQLFNAGQEQKLVNAGGSAVNRNVSISAAEVRYVEVQRGAAGSTMAVSSLALQSDQAIADTLDQMLADYKNRSGSGSGFDPFFNNSGMWRFESFVASGSSWQRTQTLDQQFQFQQQQLQLTINSWKESGSTVDLVEYMEVMGLCDPLVLDLGGEGINLRSAEDGVYFDIKGDGSPVRTAFIQGNNAFLYLDGNGNGVVDDVSELFGDHGGYANGFEKLRQYDENGDGVIDENDSIYHDLRVWRDLNGDGVNQENESMTLAEAGVKSINLNYRDEKSLDAHGNVIGERSSFERHDGTRGDIVDAWLKNMG